MNERMDIESARRHFAEAIVGSGIVPKSTHITIRDEPALGDAAAFHCRWPLTEKGRVPKKSSREITVQITSTALNNYRGADSKARHAMLVQFVRVFGVRLREGKYDENAPQLGPFIVSIDEHTLD